MFAINHAATALIFKKKFPAVKMFWLLISVQLVEIMWVILNLFNIEQTTTEAKVSYIGHIHLSYMPFSHSILTSFVISFISYFAIRYLFKDKQLALPFSLGVLSHIILDLITHAQDIPLLFGNNILMGSTLYSAFPYLAFSLELVYGIFCWFYYGGSKKLLAVIALFNLANFTTFSPDVVGLEKYFAGNPLLLTVVIGVQIIITLCLVGHLSAAAHAKDNSVLLHVQTN